MSRAKRVAIFYFVAAVLFLAIAALSIKREGLSISMSGWVALSGLSMFWGVRAWRDR